MRYNDVHESTSTKLHYVLNESKFERKNRLLKLIYSVNSFIFWKVLFARLVTYVLK